MPIWICSPTVGCSATHHTKKVCVTEPPRLGRHGGEGRRVHEHACEQTRVFTRELLLRSEEHGPTEADETALKTKSAALFRSIRTGP